jgi:hypothetical protein
MADEQQQLIRIRFSRDQLTVTKISMQNQSRSSEKKDW